MQKHKPLGEILKDADLIDDTHLQNALSTQKRLGGRIGEHFVKAGLITEDQLLDALSMQLGVAKINFAKSHIYADALKLVPKQICQRYCVVPIAVKNDKGHRKLLLAMEDPTNYQAIQEVEFASAHSVVTALGAVTDIRRAIEYCYHPDGLRESQGLSEIADVIELETTLIGTDDEPIIINPESEFTHHDKRYNDVTMRVLIDLLISKGLFSQEEFRIKLAKAREQSDPNES